MVDCMAAGTAVYILHTKQTKQQTATTTIKSDNYLYDDVCYV